MTMNILMTGASGLVGSALASFLTGHAHRVTRLVRRTPKPDADEIFWDPDAGRLDPAALDGFDALVHLAGESIAAARWTNDRKRRILESRINGTKLLVSTLATLARPPAVMISTSAVGYYGDRGGEVLREESGPGTGFLADVCRQWEQAAIGATDRGFRLVVLRIGMVLSIRGGALPRMLTPFRLCVGGRIGTGNQYISWVTLDDLIQMVRFGLENVSLDGAINAVTPNPVTNLEFTKTLGRVLRRPTAFPLPSFAVRLMFGEMGEQVLLSSARVEPSRLMTANFQFRHPDLEGALRHVLALGRTYANPRDL
jgi:uncharacterized protein (TIGR01777 family)